MGDHASSIAKATIRMKGEERLLDVEKQISEMGKAVKHIVEDALNAYINGDDKKAYEIAATDEIIDNYFKDIQNLAVDH